LREVKQLRAETAQRILWFAMVFIVLTIIALVSVGAAALVFIPLIDWVPIVTDPTLLAFLQQYSWVIPIVIWILAALAIVYLGVIYYWRKDPMAHRTGLTILGILNLLGGFSLPGLLILLPGLLLEESQ
jgi:hypothetical protein